MLTGRLFVMAITLGIDISEHYTVNATGCAAVLKVDKDFQQDSVIMLADDLDDEQRVDVLTFCLALLILEPENVAYNICSLVGVGREGLPGGTDAVGHTAWHIARAIGRDAPSPIFDIVTPPPGLELDGGPEGTSDGPEPRP